MFKNTLKGLSVVLGLIFVIGCASTKGVEVRRYIEVKDRVDQKMEGNAGYIGGTPKEIDRSNIRPTRKIYVLEVSKGDPVEGTVVEDSGYVQERVRSTDKTTVEKAVYVEEEDDYGSDNFIAVSKDDTAIPFIGDETGRNAGKSSTMTSYTVQKDDTLQKISKKFYDSFSKWSKIYEVNKDVIDDPDRIKPGTVIQIPSL